MYNVDFGTPAGPQQHVCDANQEGDWIVFRCPLCKDYERRINWRTGEMEAKNQSAFVSHSGKHCPSVFKEMANQINKN